MSWVNARIYGKAQTENSLKKKYLTLVWFNTVFDCEILVPPPPPHVKSRKITIKTITCHEFDT